MFVLNDDMSIYATRGDTVFFTVGATDGSGEKYKFKPDDVVRFKAFEKKACENVVAQKDFVITEETEEVNILLTEDDTRFGKIISKPRDYWYEIELNPFTNPQTIIGYDDDGPKVFRLYPESKNIVKDISEEDFYADAELSMTSTNPVQNQAVTRAVANLSKHIDDGLKGVKESVLSEEEALRIRGELRRLDAEVTQQKSDFNELDARKLGAIERVDEYIEGSIASFLGALPDFASGYITYSDVTDGPSGMKSGVLFYSRINAFSSRTFLSAMHEGRFATGIYDKGTISWGEFYGEHNLPIDLLWENASPTSEMYTQTLNIDISKYRWLAINYKMRSWGEGCKTVIVPSKTGEYIMRDAYNVEGAARYQERAITLNAENKTIYIGTGYLAHTGDPVGNAGMTIFTEIIGIK